MRRLAHFQPFQVYSDRLRANRRSAEMPPEHFFVTFLNGSVACGEEFGSSLVISVPNWQERSI